MSKSAKAKCQYTTTQARYLRKMSKTTIELYTTLTHTHAHMKKPIHRSLCNLINAHEMEHEFIHTGEIQLPFDYNEFRLILRH